MNTSLRVVYLIFLFLASSVRTQDNVSSKVALVVDPPYYNSDNSKITITFFHLQYLFVKIFLNHTLDGNGQRTKQFDIIIQTHQLQALPVVIIAEMDLSNVNTELQFQMLGRLYQVVCKTSSRHSSNSKFQRTFLTLAL